MHRQMWPAAQLHNDTTGLKDPTANSDLEYQILLEKQVFGYNKIMLLTSKGLGPDTWSLYQ